MKFAVLSLNVDGLKESPNKQIPQFFKSDEKYDYYVEFTQEDSRPVDTFALVGAIPYGLPLLASKSLNSHTSPQNILTKIYSDRSKDCTIETGTVPLAIRNTKAHQYLLRPILTATGFATKGAVWVSLSYPTYSLLFINMHLPVKVSTKEVNGEKQLKNETLGYNYRKKSLLHVFNALREQIRRATFTIVGGDLNFRMNKEGANQLNQALANTKTGFEEFEFPEGTRKKFTCKFTGLKEYTKKVNRLEPSNNTNSKERKKFLMNNFHPCRLQPIGESTQKSICHNTERDPSRCDRFLFSGKVSPTVLKQDAVVYLEDSDHNALCIVFEVDIPKRGGVRNKTRKHLYKNAMLKKHT